jgi:hypothetical protein
MPNTFIVLYKISNLFLNAAYLDSIYSDAFICINPHYPLQLVALPSLKKKQLARRRRIKSDVCI